MSNIVKKPGRPKNSYNERKTDNDNEINGVYNNSIETRYFQCKNCNYLNDVQVTLRQIQKRVQNKLIQVDPKIWDIFKQMCIASGNNMNTMLTNMIGVYQKVETSRMKRNVKKQQEDDGNDDMISGIVDVDDIEESEGGGDVN